MSAQENNVVYPTRAVIIGFNTPLVEALKKNLQNNRISVRDITWQSQPYPIESENLQIMKESRYVFYLLPEAILDSLTYQIHAQILSNTLDRVSRAAQKLTLILRDPSDYVIIGDSSQFPHLDGSKEKILTHQSHLLNCVEKTKQNSLVDSRIIAIKNLLVENPKQDTPLIVDMLYSDLPNSIIVPQKSNTLLSPVQVDVACRAVVKTTFSAQSKHQVYVIEGDQQIPIINLGYQLKTHQQLSTQAQITLANINQNNLNFPASKISVNNPNLINALHNAITHALENPPTTHIKKVVIPAEPIQSKPKKLIQNEKIKLTPKKQINRIPKLPKPGGISWMTVGILSIIFVVFSLLFITPFIYINSFINTTQHLQSGNAQKAAQIATKIQVLSPIIKKLGIIYVPAAKLVIGDISVSQYHSIIDATDEVLEIIGQSDEIITSVSQTLELVLSGDRGDIKQNIESLSTSLDKIYQEASFVQASLESVVSNQKIKPGVKNQLKSMLEKLETTRKYLQTASQLFTIANDFLGVDGSKTYLVLLQNNHELRATGGFIGSFALITFDQGRLLDVETHDVYAADGQLRGHVEPPAEIKKHLGEANWYLRDSNWDPNFPTSARRAEWFLGKEMNRQVDGTIAIDLNVVKGLLDVVGGVDLVDYNETITAENLFQRAEYQSELNYFEGSTQKKDFLSAIVNALFTKLSTPNPEWGIGVVMSLVESANQSHLQVSVNDNRLESVLESINLSGKVVSPNCVTIESEACLTNYFGIVESNVGVNKVNYFVERDIAHTSTINASTIASQTKVLIKNTAKTAAWPAGTYKNYFRFVVPQYASVTEVTIDGKKVATNKLTIETRHQKKYVGTLLEVPINSQKTIELAYEYINPSKGESKLILQTYFEKQSGTDQDPLYLKIVNNSILNATLIDQGEIVGNETSLKTTTLKDVDWQVSFQP